MAAAAAAAGVGAGRAARVTGVHARLPGTVEGLEGEERRRRAAAVKVECAGPGAGAVAMSRAVRLRVGQAGSVRAAVSIQRTRRLLPGRGRGGAAGAVGPRGLALAVSLGRFFVSGGRLFLGLDAAAFPALLAV